MSKTVRQDGREKVNEDTVLLLTWELDGRKRDNRDGHMVNRTRRLRLSWTDIDDMPQHVYLIMVVPPEKGGYQSSEAYAMSTPDSHFLGRRNLKFKERHALMKSWIDICVSKHATPCSRIRGTELGLLKLVGDTYFGVIDVVDMQLKSLPVDGTGIPKRYVALSYVWGSPASLKGSYITTRRNVMTRIRHGGLQKEWHLLPRTIQDAILLVGRLGERYLWIDSLCIVQDSASSWKLNAAAMHLVYGNAHFTICAADGDATTGLVAAWPILHAGGEGGDQTSTLEDKACKLPSAECLPGVRLLAVKPPEAAIRASRWDQRAWTFQERLLSRRCLIFADGQTYFQCRSTVMSPDVVSDGGGSGWSLDWTNSPLRTLGQLRRKAFWFYMKFTPLYTSRQLSKPQDILTAFQGTSWLLQQRLNSPLLFGLPSSHFDLALLWTPTRAHRRREHPAKCPDYTCLWGKTSPCDCNADTTGYGETEFPSWSWSGWMGGEIEYHTDMIEGCIINANEWLTHRTWILWHFRDYHGNLRPLWDRAIQKEDLSKEIRWRGYAGRPTWTQAETGCDNTWDSPDDCAEPQSHKPQIRPKKYWHSRPSMVRVSNDLYLNEVDEYFHDSDLTREKSGARDLEAKRREMTKLGMDLERDEQARRHDEEKPMLMPRSPPGALSSRTRRGHSVSRAKRASPSPHREEESSDPYGRPPRKEFLKNASDFYTILPENPFGVARGPFPPSRRHYKDAMPILQFWTWKKDLFIQVPGAQKRLVRGSDGGSDSASGSASPNGGGGSDNGLVRCHLIDPMGDWCGAITMPRAEIRYSPEKGHEGVKMTFIALSEAKAFTRDECPVWTYYIPKERNESEWDLYYVLLLKWNLRRTLWERVALGKVFKDAFGDAEWKEIKLG